MQVRMIGRPKKEPRKVSMKLVDGSVVRGYVNLYQEEGLLNRVSDLFTKTKEPFIVMFQATAEGMHDRVFIVNKSNIVWISPED